MPGSSGAYARLPVGWVHRGDSVLVLNPARPMVDGTALVHELKRGIVMMVHAQVIGDIRSLFLHIHLENHTVTMCSLVDRIRKLVLLEEY